MNGPATTSVGDDAARARSIGVRVSLSEFYDRLPSRERMGEPCPTCDDGILTVSNPARCIDCTTERDLLS